MNLELWKKIKKEKKLTLNDISILSNIPKRTVDDIFAGVTKSPRTDTVEAIEKALGLRQKPNIPKIDEMLTKDENTVIKLFNSLDRKKLVLEILNNLI